MKKFFTGLAIVAALIGIGAGVGWYFTRPAPVVETHVHLHIDGAFVGDQAGLARELRRVFNGEADRFGWARA